MILESSAGGFLGAPSFRIYICWEKPPRRSRGGSLPLSIGRFFTTGRPPACLHANALRKEGRSRIRAAGHKENRALPCPLLAGQRALAPSRRNCSQEITDLPMCLPAAALGTGQTGQKRRSFAGPLSNIIYPGAWRCKCNSPPAHPIQNHACVEAGIRLGTRRPAAGGIPEMALDNPGQIGYHRAVISHSSIAVPTYGTENRTR